MKKIVQLLTLGLTVFTLMPLMAQNSVGLMEPLAKGVWRQTQDFAVWNSKYQNYHLGEDWVTYETKPIAVYAAYDGVIKHNARRTGYGRVVIIEHIMPDGSKICTVYGHMGDKDIANVGNQVKKGTQLGWLSIIPSDYGSCEHLHFGIRKGAYSTTWLYAGYGTLSETQNWYDPSNYIASSQNNFLLNMGGSWSVYPNPMKKNNIASITVIIKNVGNRTFNGSVSVALLNSKGEYVGDIGIKSDQSISAGNAKSFLFIKTILSVPGSYSLVTRIKPVNGSWYDVPKGSYINPLNITIQEVECAIPTGVYHSSVTSTTARINWNLSLKGVGYSIQYRSLGGAWITISNIPDYYIFKNLTGLKPSTTYEYNLRRNCSSNDSQYSAMGTFVTKSAPKSIQNSSAQSDSIGKVINRNETEVKENSIKLYPNPASNNITLVNPLRNSAEYVILDMMGCIRLSGSIHNSEQIIDITTLIKGIYIVRVVADGKYYEPLRFIKQ